MADKTKIGWTDATWNPVTGCSKVSTGCKHCYAEREWPRLAGNSKTIYAGRKFTEVQCHPERLEQPLRWTKPRRIFVNSMSDLFHPCVPFEFIASVFAIMGATQRHTYQVLTKRPERMLEFFQWVAEGAGIFENDRISDYWPAHIKWQPARNGRGGYDCCGPQFPYPNVWIGVSVEDQKTADERIPLLLQTPAAVRWISAEPLLGKIELRQHSQNHWHQNPTVTTDCWIPWNDHPDDYMFAVHSQRKIDWVVAGGESGPHARPMHPDWVRSLRDQCAAARVPFMFKQWGAFITTSVFDDPHFTGGRAFNHPTGGRCAAIQTIHKPGTRNIHKTLRAGDATAGYYMFDDDTIAVLVGGKRSGRLLDGELHDAYPEVAQ